MALLFALSRLAPMEQWILTAAHCHHGLRGESADLDESLVEKTCRKLDVAFQGCRVDVRKSAKETGESLEMAARRLRHAFLAAAAHQTGTSRVVLAHHADDQAELVLLRLLRGSGSDGLGGMRDRSPSPADPQIQLIRPLLWADRSAILRFARAHRIRFREDASNRDRSIPRNQVRHQLIPYLKRNHSPALPRILTRIASIAGAESDFLHSEADRWQKRSVRRPFSKLPLALQRIVLRRELWEQGRDVDFDTLERLRRRRQESPKLEAENPSPKRLEENRGEMDPVRLELSQDGKASRRGRKLEWKVRRSAGAFSPASEQLDADAVGPVGLLRNRRPGDRFQGLGMPRPARLQNLFINRKIPQEERDRVLILETSEGRIAWVEGFPPGEEFKRTSKTRRFLVLKGSHGD
jgi:tRNA(Ile)-lysidine synthase